MEIELILQFVLIFALGLCVGLPFSSRLGTKHLKEHVRFLEGKINRYKQDKPSGGGIMDLLSGGFDEKNIMKILSGLKPEQIQKGMDLLKGIQGGGDQNKGVDTWR
tara:strand:- start:560 stop:877 length:318 start_codon:yes stop_codon:yes gene_type:complete